MSSENEKYDLEKVYDEKIAPLMTQIIDICREHKMPVLASFAYGRNEEKSDFCTTYLEFENRVPEPFRPALSLIKNGFAPLTITTKLE